MCTYLCAQVNFCPFLSGIHWQCTRYTCIPRYSSGLKIPFLVACINYSVCYIISVSTALDDCT